MLAELCTASELHYNGLQYLGGLDEERSYNLVERYDPEANSWSTVASMIGMRCGAGAASVGRYLYVVGGNDGETSTNTVERYFNTTVKFYTHS